MPEVKKFCVMAKEFAYHPDEENLWFSDEDKKYPDLLYKKASKAPSLSVSREPNYRGVKIGYSWKAFVMGVLCGSPGGLIWLLYHRMYADFSAVLFLFMVFSVFIYKGDFSGTPFLVHWIIMNVVWAAEGYLFNFRMVKKLSSKGYKVKDVVYAVNSEEAVARYFMKNERIHA